MSNRLTLDFGKGYSQASLFRMIRLYDVFPDDKIFATLLRKLSWSHFIELMKIDDSLKREFYIQICINEKWPVRTLQERINSMLYERTAISGKPEKTILNDLERAILSELQKFILEMGTDFAFLARQKRMIIDNDNYYTIYGVASRH